MTDKILNWIERMKTKMGTKTYNITFALFAICTTTLVSIFGGAHFPAIMGIFAACLNNVALFLLIISTLQYFQGGVSLNIQKKIFEEGNVAVAIYQGMIYLGIALLIGNAIM